MSFRLLVKSVTLDGVMAVILRCFSEFGSFRGTLHKNYIPKLSATAM